MLKLFFLLCAVFLSSFASANSEQVGVVVKLQGDVKIFTNPSLNSKGPSPRVLFEGTYYSVKKAKLGFKVNRGNIVQTGHDSKVRIIFKNGDQYNVGAGTAYKVSWSSVTKRKKSNSIINLMRGKIRAVVSKNGSRNNLKVRTKFAAMGVRGTDFFVSKRGSLGTAKLTVLRGEVEIKLNIPKKKSVKKIEKPKAVKVASGFSAKWTAENIEKLGQKDSAEVVSPRQEIKLLKTTKRELGQVQKASVIILKDKEKEAAKAAPKAVVKEVKKLEEKAYKTTLQDIKEHDPVLYEQVKKEKVSSALVLNTKVVKKILKVAPETLKKPDEDELEDFDEGDYDKYFDVE